jgi:hypothetical protein
MPAGAQRRVIFGGRWRARWHPARTGETLELGVSVEAHQIRTSVTYGDLYLTGDPLAAWKGS